jgi:hypothetical protein
MSQPATGATSARNGWLFASVGAVALVTGLLLLFRAPRGAALTSQPAKVVVAMTSSPSLHDEAEVFDPTPLFLPTKFNAAPKGVEMPEFGAAFPNYLPKLGFDISGLKLDGLSLPKPVADPPSPATAPGAVLTMPSAGALASGFGRTESVLPALSARGGYVEIVSARTGQRVASEALAASARPPGNSPWAPLEFVAAIEPAGLLGSLVLTARSGVEEVDAFFQNYLARTWRLAERLPPDFYRISVGP